jgi:hypothetical protein
VLAVGGEAAARYDDVGVWMVGQCRSPGVQHGGEPDAGAEVLGVGGDGDQGLGGGFEQQVIDDRLVVIGDVGDRSGQCEDDMEIMHGQEFGLAVGQPFLGSHGLALWAMPIAAGVVRDAQSLPRRKPGWAHSSQRSTCPPNAPTGRARGLKAHVRQRSIADMTLSWPRLT